MAPKREGTPITVRLPDGMIAKIAQYCLNTGQSRAEVIRQLLFWQLIKIEEGHDDQTT